MSSFRKASKINQKTHRERHQPEKRAHLGLLEKKKDYKYRANDYHNKQKVLKKLKILAQNRNPDEFYFHMINSKIVNGRHKEKVKPVDEDTLEQKKLMDNRNLTYVAMKRTIEHKKVSKLQSNLHLTDFAKSVKSSHLHFDCEGNPVVASTSEDNKQIKNDLNIPDIDGNTLKKMNKLKLQSYKSLAQRIERTKQLSIIQRKMEMQNYLSNKSTTRPALLQKGTKSQAPVFVWKYERKR